MCAKVNITPSANKFGATRFLSWHAFTLAGHPTAPLVAMHQMSFHSENAQICFERTVVWNGSTVFGHRVKSTAFQGFGKLICASHFSPGFSLQSYFGLQKSSTMDNAQANFKADDPAHFMPPKIEISGIEAKPAPQRPHKLKPRDMNVLTPSGFWISHCFTLLVCLLALLCPLLRILSSTHYIRWLITTAVLHGSFLTKHRIAACSQC